MAGPSPEGASEPMVAILEGLRVVELASDRAAYAGKLLGDLGADVVVVEPPGGHPSRRYGPFVDDEPDPDRCLWWWNYNTSKRSVVLDLDDEEGRD
ncbi:MAG TPA: CoA transferase, partial [Acidimicrobiales bacterium]